MRQAILSYGLLLVTFSCFAQLSLPLSNLTEEDGLSNGFVISIYQDEKGFIWFGTANGLNRYDGYQFKTWIPEENNPNSLSHNIVWTLYGTADGIVWIGTDKGLNRFDPETETFTQYFHDPNDINTLSNDLITAICEDREGNLWVGTGNALSVLQKGTNHFSRHFYDPAILKGRGVRSIIRDEEGFMWFGIMDTLYCFNPTIKNFQGFELPFSEKQAERSTNFIKSIIAENATYLWLSTDINGIYLFDKKVCQFIAHFKNNPNDNNSLSHNRISSFLKDDKGNLWIGSYGGGLNIMSSDRQLIHRFQPDPFNPIHQNFDVVRSMLRDKSGNIWLGTFYGGAKVLLKYRKPFINYVPIPGKPNSIGGTKPGQLFERSDGSIWTPIDDYGLALFDPKTELFTNFAPSTKKAGSLNSKNIISIIEDSDRDLWVLTFTEIWKMDSRTKQWKNLQPSGLSEKNGFLLCQFKDKKGTHWIGTQGGLFQYDQASNALAQQHLDIDATDTKHGDNTYVESFFESKNGDLWVATHGGLNLRPTGSNHFQFYPFHQQVLSIHLDKSGTIWLGTIGGLAFFNTASKKVEFYPMAKGIAGKLIHSILEDNHGKFWMASKAGLICFDPATGISREYNQKDGLANRQFFRSYLKSQTGEFYFGGTKGLLRFHPDSILENPFIPPIVLTNFRLFNKDVPIRGSIGDTLRWKSPLLKNIAYTDHILLQHWQNDFAFEFAALDFTAPMNNRYRFMLEGYDIYWVEASASQRFAHYTNLRPGNYIFKVMGSNNDEKWNEKETSVSIIILPPWWQTWWAYLLYAALTFVILYRFYRYQLGRQLAKAETKRLLELDTFKSTLYTNITHEFRTPLTVILGMAEQLEQKKPKVGLQEGITLIKRNGKRLLELINQMLDLAKLDANQLSVEYIQDDIVLYIGYIVQSFESFARSKNIRLHFLPKEESVLMDFDKEKLLQILTNLLSNAIKFTPRQGNVYVQLEKQFNDKKTQLEITVKDTGEGIPLDQQAKIFERFQQVDDSTTRRFGGTGIGLALTKELVQLLNGTITVQSDIGKGATFIVTLPIHNEANLVESIADVPKMNENMLSTTSDSAVTETSLNLPVLLIIEDNADVITYLQACFKQNYRIEVAENGKVGIEKALELVPDIVISDVMMPEKDGFKVLTTLKQDERTSHIPIVLLTAKADFSSTIKGLERGADAYISKPFNEQELRIRLNNLLEIRKKLQSRYAQIPPAPTADKETQIEDAFVAKVRAAILEHLDDENWKIPQLASQLRLSREHLHRKMKSLTGKSTSQFIRFVKMHQAKDLLETTDLNISEVAYRVGYKELAHFSVAYKEEFGVSPSGGRK